MFQTLATRWLKNRLRVSCKHYVLAAVKSSLGLSLGRSTNKLWLASTSVIPNNILYVNKMSVRIALMKMNR